MNKVIFHKCWICEGYNELQFQVTIPERFKDTLIDTVFIHLEFESYEPRVMLKKEMPV